MTDTIGCVADKLVDSFYTWSADLQGERAKKYGDFCFFCQYAPVDWEKHGQYHKEHGHSTTKEE